MTDQSHCDHDLASFEIIHPDHGSARCDERQLADFEAAGWKKKKEPKGKSENLPQV